MWNILSHRNVLDFLTNIEESEDLQKLNFEKIIGEILSQLRDNLNVIILANYVIGETILDVLNTERHVFGQ